MSELIYIPEHFVSVEAGAGLGSRTRQIPMTDNLGIRKHLIKDGQQVGEPLCLSGRASVAWQSVLLQPALVADADGTVVVRHGVSPHFQQYAVLRHRTVVTDIEVIPDLAEPTRTKIKRSIFFE